MNDIYSIKPEDFVNQVEIISKSKLKRKFELLKIFQLAIDYANQKEFEELLFSAKYAMGLMRILKNHSGNSEIKNIEEIKKDFASTIEMTTGQLRRILQNSDNELRKHFDANFLELSPQNFSNLTELLSDLEFAKIYLNDYKRNQPK
jgi:hypothetical protein